MVDFCNSWKKASVEKAIFRGLRKFIKWMTTGMIAAAKATSNNGFKKLIQKVIFYLSLTLPENAVARRGISQQFLMIARTTHSISFFFIFLLIASGCSHDAGDREWWSAIPEEVPAVILFHDAELGEALQDRRIMALGELSDFRSESILAIEERIASPATLKAVALYPTGAHQLQPLFIMDDPGPGIRSIARQFRREFAENSYRFHNHDIHILHLDREELYAAQLRDQIFLSRNSVAVENSILAHKGVHPGIGIDETALSGGSYLLNTQQLSRWLGLLGAPRFLPRFAGLFEGTGATVLTLSGDRYDDPLFDVSLSGSIPLDLQTASGFVNTFSAEPGTSDLDRYIPSDVAFFAIFRLEPDARIPDNVDRAGRLDSLLLSDPDLLSELRGTLAHSAAFLTFEASGFLSVGEHSYLRRLEDPAGFQRILRQLLSDGFIEESNDVYFVNSNVLGRLLGGPQSRLTDFHVMRSANAALITKRSGLARRIDQDRRRRAVVYYDDAYMRIRERHPESVSVWMYSRSEPLLNYLEPMLNPQNHARFLGSLLDTGAMSLVRDNDRLSFRLDTYFSEDRTEPVRDVWVFDLRGSRITGKPLFANIGGGARDEIVVATESNHIYGIAADGTGFLEINTGNDRPVGSPLVYDWYANNQYAILIAAGNKIYAWNSRGVPLPNFPVTMEERITAPLALADVARDGRPEMIVATADRKVHVLDQRGRNIQGWPQDVNIHVTRQPVFRDFGEGPSVWVAAGNGLFAFSPRGNLRNDYPVFIESDLGPFTFHRNHILAGAADGHLYAIGPDPFFADTLAVPMNNGQTADPDQLNGSAAAGSGSLHVRRVYVGNAPILNAPIVQTLTIDHGNGQRIRERMIGVQTQNGNLFLLNEAGHLRMTRNMGQPAAAYDNMLLTDVNGNGKTDMLGVSANGRVYAWQVESGEQVPHIPSASMSFPVAADIMGNGDMELIGQTRDGLRCWSFRRPQD